MSRAYIVKRAAWCQFVGPLWDIIGDVHARHDAVIVPLGFGIPPSFHFPWHFRFPSRPDGGSGLSLVDDE